MTVVNIDAYAGLHRGEYVNTHCICLPAKDTHRANVRSSAFIGELIGNYIHVTAEFNALTFVILRSLVITISLV